MIAYLDGIERIGTGRYRLRLRCLDSSEFGFELRVIDEPVPTVVWGDSFEDQIGTLSDPGQALLRAVLDFHRGVLVQIPVRVP